MPDDVLELDPLPATSPLLAAARELGGSATEKVSAEGEGGDEGEAEGAGDAGDEGKGDEGDGSEARTGAEGEGGETGEGEDKGEEGEAGEAEGEEGEGVESVVPPLPGREEGGPDSATLVLEGVTPEFRDRIAAHVARSEKLERVEQQRDKLEERVDQHESTVAYLDYAIEKGDPGVMFWLESQKPELGMAFARNWMERHPVEAMKVLIDDLKLDKETDAEKLTLRADKAERDASDKLKTSFSEVSATRTLRRYSNRAEGVFNDVAAGIDKGDQTIFAKLANAELTELWHTRAKAGQPPPTNSEIRAALTPLVERLTGKKPPKPATGQGGKSSKARTVEVKGTKDGTEDLLGRAAKTPEEYREKLRRAKALRAGSAGATGGITSYLRAGGMKRIKPAAGETALAATIKAMKRGQI